MQNSFLTITAPSIEPLRAALQAIPRQVAQHGSDAPSLEQVFVVPSHLAALDPDNLLVIGDRGVGKSFWSACLNSAQTRQLIGQEIQRHDFDDLQVSWGFSTTSVAMIDHPSKRVLRELIQAGIDAQSIWRTVILYQLSRHCGQVMPGTSWLERVRLLADSAEREEQWLAEAAQRLTERGMRHLIVFDALDRMADSWQEIRMLVQGLLKVCLDFRSYPALRIKLFMRTDMWDDSRIWAFPDASKLRHGKVVLQWRKTELYGLLWHWLANHPASGDAFRTWLQTNYRQSFQAQEIACQRIYAAPRVLLSDETLQAEIFSHLASPFMGSNHRKGRTYTWLPNHLADARGQVSPRSFLAALRVAADSSHDRSADAVLHFEAIKLGVQEASLIRVDELSEDYPWINVLLNPLRGMSVPCETAEVLMRWQRADALTRIEQDMLEAHRQGNEYLAPHGALESATASDASYGELLQDLIRIGVISTSTDQRLNMPDLFRVASGIGRRGGVKAIR